jgi:hypothetical protein
MSFLDAWDGQEEDNLANQVPDAPLPQSPLLTPHKDMTKEAGTYPVADWLGGFMSSGDVSDRDPSSPLLAGYGPSDAGASTPAPVSAKPELMSTVSNTDPVTDLIGLLSGRQNQTDGSQLMSRAPASSATDATPSADDDSDSPTPSSMRMPASPKSAGPPSTIDVGKSRFNQEGLANAQKREAGAELAAGLGKAFNTIGAGITRTQVDPNQQKAFDLLGKDAGTITQNYLQQQANEKNDPNSPMSKAFRQYANSLGVNIKGDFTAADGEKLLPMIFKGYEAKQAQIARTQDLQMKLAEHKDEMLQRDKDRAALQKQLAVLKGQNKASDSQDKVLVKVNQQIANLSKGRGAIGNAYEAERLTDNADSILQKYAGHYDKIPPKMVNAFIAEFGKIAKGGVAGHSEFKEFMPSDISSKLAAGWGQLSGNPTGAGLGKFINDYADYLHELRGNSRRYIGTQINSMINANEPVMNPAHVQNLRQVHQKYLSYVPQDQQQMAGASPGMGGGSGSGKTVVKAGYNSKTNQTQIIYSDGTKEVVSGKVNPYGNG